MDGGLFNPVKSAQERHALQIALWAGFLILGLKAAAYFLTHSTALLSDAIESVVHLVAALFAYVSWKVSQVPADEDHPHGHAKISFFSAGFEGAVICLSALMVAFAAWDAWWNNRELHEIRTGVLFTFAILVINTVLGCYLVWRGQKNRSLIVEAHGKHVLTDCVTSVGALVGLSLVMWTGWREWDRIVTLLMSVNLGWAGIQLVRRAFSGLMDESNLVLVQELTALLKVETARRGISFHELRHRDVGDAESVELHLMFPDATTLKDAHRMASEIEFEIEQVLRPGSRVLTHLECQSDHDAAHEAARLASLERTGKVKVT
jgi:cation diffusion facilitator family transporter